MGEFRMPSLGADMDEGTLVEWRVAVGDHVDRGDIVAAVDTDKSTIEVEVFESGTVTALLVEPGDTVPVGTPLATIDSSGAGEATGAAAPEASSPPDTDDAGPGPRPAPPVPPPAPTSGEHRHRPVTSPLVRHRADELGVDLDDVTGTGPGGTVTRADVAAAAMSRPATADGATRSTGGGPTRHPADLPATVGAAGGWPDATRAAGPVGTGGGPGVGVGGAVGGHGLRVPASPLARHRAEQAGLDIADVVGTGPGGAVIAADVDAALAHRAAAPFQAAGPAAGPLARSPEAAGTAAATSGRPVTTDRRASLRRAVGELMARSAREIPHYHLTSQIDLATATAWLAERNAERPVAERVLPAAVLLRAVVLACGDAPELNGHWVDGGLRRGDGVHLGVAVSLRGGGLVAPAIRDAHELGLDEIMSRLRDLVTRARAGSLRASEMSDPTITVTNLGDSGVDAVHGVIFPPQVALVGFGRIAERPWARDGMLGVHPIVTATLAADHRATDGRDGARFLAAVDHHLQHPEDL